MQRIFSIILTILLATISVKAETAAGYEWWFDDDYTNRQAGTLSTDNVSLSPDLSDMLPGFHSFNMRLRTSQGTWGSTYSKIFFTTPTEVGAAAYEYWLDNNYASKVEGNLQGDNNVYTVSLEGLKKGLHRFSYRLKTYDGTWGAVYSKVFWISSETTATNYEYWFDNDYENKVAGVLQGKTMTQSIDLGSLSKEGVHFFNMRIRDDNGDWGSIYHKLLVFYDKLEKAKILGYRHSLNGVDLGYEKLENDPSGKYMFTVDLPENQQIDLSSFPIAFDGDNLSISGSTTFNYRIQIESDAGWAPPTEYSFDGDFDYSTTADLMDIPSSLTFAIPTGIKFKAIKFNSTGKPIYMSLDHSANVDIYKDGLKTESIVTSKLSETNTLTLNEGTYYAVIYNVASNGLSENEEEVLLKLDIQENKAPTPSIEGYDGRYLKISFGNGLNLEFINDGRHPVEESFDDTHTVVKFDLGGLMPIHFRTIGEGYDASDEVVFTPEYYSNEEVLMTTAPHQADAAFGWTDDYADIHNLTVTGTLCDGTSGDTEDYGVLKRMPYLWHLNLHDVTDKTVPDGALASECLKTVVMPSGLVTAGNNLFGESNTTLSAIELTSQAVAPSNLLDGVANPNILLCVADKKFAAPLEGKISNVVYGDAQFTADAITLTHGYPFFALKTFVAKEISFTREFTKETSIDGFGSGWETLSLPFDVTTIKSGETLLQPFAVENREGKPFWLYEASGTDWERSAAIHANSPYLIAIPNNPWYDDEYKLAGTITFSATSAEIAASEDAYTPVGIGGNYVHTNYSKVAADANVLALNEELVAWNNVSYLPGGIFAKGLKDVAPFECYLTSDSEIRFAKIFGTTDVENIEAGSALHIWTEGNDVCIHSGIDCKLPIYDTMGQLLRIADVKGGETTRETGLRKGIYLIGNKKIYVK